MATEALTNSYSSINIRPCWEHRRCLSSRGNICPSLAYVNHLHHIIIVGAWCLVVITFVNHLHQIIMVGAWW
eukprot:516257-Prorocentrum_minimum.AAC.7